SDMPSLLSAAVLSAGLPTFSPRSSASFLIVSSSIEANASRARKPARSVSTAHSVQGIHHSALPLASLESLKRSERTRSLSELGLLFSASAICHLPMGFRNAGLVAFWFWRGAPEVGAQHVEGQVHELAVVERVRISGLLHGEAVQDRLHQGREGARRNLAHGGPLLG